MSKKKMTALVILGVLLFYAISVGIVFFVARDKAASDFNSVYSKFCSSSSDVAQGYEKYGKNNNTDFESLVFDMQCFYGSNVFLSAIIDENGNVISKTKSAAKISIYNGDKNEEETYILDLEKHLTDEDKIKIDEFQKSRVGGMVLSRIDIYENEKERIPVSIFFTGKNRKDLTNQELKIRLTKYDANRSFFADDENCSYSWYLYNIGQEEYSKECFGVLERELDEFSYYVKESSENATEIESSIPAQVRILWGTQEFLANGKKYYVYTSMAQNVWIDTLKGDAFEEYTIYLGLLFAVLGVIITSVSSALHNKSRRLDNAASAFTSAAAHELKTPLAVIQNQCECIMENIAPQKNEEYVKSIYDEALKMNALVMNILQYTKLTKDGKIKKEKCNLCKTVKEEAEKYKAFAESCGAVLECEILCEKANIRCNRELIALAIDNYLSNAVKFSKGKRTVRISLKGSKGSYSVEVYNDGDGISDSLKHSLWNVLSKEDRARTSGNGSGMGLAICKRIFEFHDCLYGFKNTQNGVVFWFTIG